MKNKNLISLNIEQNISNLQEELSNPQEENYEEQESDITEYMISKNQILNKQEKLLHSTFQDEIKSLVSLGIFVNHIHSFTKTDAHQAYLAVSGVTGQQNGYTKNPRFFHCL